MDILDIHGYPRISMDIHGYPWTSMDIHGYPWISINMFCLNPAITFLFSITAPKTPILGSPEFPKVVFFWTENN